MDARGRRSDRTTCGDRRAAGVRSEVSPRSVDAGGKPRRGSQATPRSRPPSARRLAAALTVPLALLAVGALPPVQAQSGRLCLEEQDASVLPSGFQIDGISRTDGIGFLLWDEGSSTRFVFVELVPGAGAGAGNSGQRVRLEVSDALPEAPEADLAGASFRDQHLELLPTVPDSGLRDWAESRLRTEVSTVPNQGNLVSAVRDGPVWRAMEIDETGRLRLGTLRRDSLARRSSLNGEVVSADALGQPSAVQAMMRRAPSGTTISFSRRPYRRYVVRTEEDRVEEWTALPAAVDSARRDPATGSSPIPAHWRALALVPLDRGEALQTFADLRSDRRVMARYDSTGTVVAERELDAPFATLHSIPERRLLVGTRVLGRAVELVYYRWRWVEGMEECDG